VTTSPIRWARLGAIPAESHRHTVVVHIDAPLAEVSPWFGPYSNRLVALDAGTTELRTGADRAADVPSWLADLPRPYRVIGDDAVLQAFIAAARRMLAAAAG